MEGKSDLEMWIAPFVACCTCLVCWSGTQTVIGVRGGAFGYPLTEGIPYIK